MKRNDEWLAGFMGKTVAVVFLIAAFFGLGWLVWLLWTWVLPQLWPTGPKTFVNPGYWLFVAAWFLASLVFRMIRGGKK